MPHSRTHHIHAHINTLLFFKLILLIQWLTLIYSTIPFSFSAFSNYTSSPSLSNYTSSSSSLPLPLPPPLYDLPTQLSNFHDFIHTLQSIHYPLLDKLETISAITHQHLRLTLVEIQFQLLSHKSRLQKAEWTRLWKEWYHKGNGKGKFGLNPADIQIDQIDGDERGELVKLGLCKGKGNGNEEGECQIWVNTTNIKSMMDRTEDLIQEIGEFKLRMRGLDKLWIEFVESFLVVVEEVVDSEGVWGWRRFGWREWVWIKKIGKRWLRERKIWNLKRLMKGGLFIFHFGSLIWLTNVLEVRLHLCWSWRLLGKGHRYVGGFGLWRSEKKHQERDASHHEMQEQEGFDDGIQQHLEERKGCLSVMQKESQEAPWDEMKKHSHYGSYYRHLQHDSQIQEMRRVFYPSLSSSQSLMSPTSPTRSPSSQSFAYGITPTKSPRKSPTPQPLADNDVYAYDEHDTSFACHSASQQSSDSILPFTSNSGSSSSLENHHHQIEIRESEIRTPSKTRTIPENRNRIGNLQTSKVTLNQNQNGNQNIHIRIHPLLKIIHHPIFFCLVFTLTTYLTIIQLYTSTRLSLSSSSRKCYGHKYKYESSTNTEIDTNINISTSTSLALYQPPIDFFLTDSSEKKSKRENNTPYPYAILIPAFQEGITFPLWYHKQWWENGVRVLKGIECFLRFVGELEQEMGMRVGKGMESGGGYKRWDVDMDMKDESHRENEEKKKEWKKEKKGGVKSRIQKLINSFSLDLNLQKPNLNKLDDQFEKEGLIEIEAELAVLRTKVESIRGLKFSEMFLEVVEEIVQGVELGGKWGREWVRGAWDVGRWRGVRGGLGSGSRLGKGRGGGVDERWELKELRRGLRELVGRLKVREGGGAGKEEEERKGKAKEERAGGDVKKEKAWEGCWIKGEKEMRRMMMEEGKGRKDWNEKEKETGKAEKEWEDDTDMGDKCIVGKEEWEDMKGGVFKGWGGSGGE